MAAGTVSIIHPVTSATGIITTDPLVVMVTPYNGSAAARELRVKLTSDSGGNAIVYDTLLRENDDHAHGDDWSEIPLPRLALTIGSTYYLFALRRDTGGDSTAWSTAVSLTFAAAPFSAANWRRGQ